MKLADFPQFTVVSATLLEEGWVLEGHFNHLEGVREGRCWLYVSRSESLIGDLEFPDRGSLQARFKTLDSEPLPDWAVGATLPWLDGWWQAYHVTLILDREHVWQRVVFQSSDSLAQDIPGWQVRRSAAGVAPGVGEIRIPGGWDHEHCMLCNAHIDPGDEGYVDDGQQWLCSSCYQTYAEPHDLSFVRDGIG